MSCNRRVIMVNERPYCQSTDGHKVYGRRIREKIRIPAKLCRQCNPWRCPVINESLRRDVAL